MSADEALIKSLGGVTRVAEMLGYAKAGGVQRVHNWCKRGIPPRIKLQHPNLFLPAAPAAPAANTTTTEETRDAA